MLVGRLLPADFLGPIVQDARPQRLEFLDSHPGHDLVGDARQDDHVGDLVLSVHLQGVHFSLGAHLEVFLETLALGALEGHLVPESIAVGGLELPAIGVAADIDDAEGLALVLYRSGGL